MAFERADRRFGQAIVAHLADQPLDHPRAEPLAHGFGHPRRGRVLVDRLTLVILWENPHPVPRGNKQTTGDRALRQFARHVHRRIAHADDEHPLAADRIWLVDWEYSGNCDPMWDLGDLSLEGGFDAGVKGCRWEVIRGWHTLRHSFAVHFLEQGLDLHYLQEILGHRYLQTTALYNQISDVKITKFKSPFDEI